MACTNITDEGGVELVTESGVSIVTEDSVCPDVVVNVYTTQILYNGKTLSLTRPPYYVHIDPFLPRTVNRTLTGVTETLRHPRLSVAVGLAFRPASDSYERMRCDTFFQWAQRGGAFRIILDSSKASSTTLSGAASSGATLLSLASASGIIVGNIYAVIGGPNYQLVQVVNISSNNVTLATGLDAPFPAGSVFRDWLLWDGILQDSDAHSPINDLVSTHRQDSFDWTLEFAEATP